MEKELLQFGGSLIAILALAGTAWWLKLGGDRRIRHEADLRELAEEALCGFDPIEIAIGDEGRAALARDGDGRVMLLRRHGAHFASRLLDSASSAHATETHLVVRSGDRRFGEARLDLGDQAGAWAKRINAL